jgi:hypothetical protein
MVHYGKFTQSIQIKWMVHYGKFTQLRGSKIDLCRNTPYQDVIVIRILDNLGFVWFQDVQSNRHS